MKYPTFLFPNSIFLSSQVSAIFQSLNLITFISYEIEMEIEMTTTEIGTRIREIREEKNMSRETLAAHSEISTKFLYEIENGKKGISAETLFKISKSLGCSCDYLLTGTEQYCDSSTNILKFINTLEPKQQKRILKILKLLYEFLINK